MKKGTYIALLLSLVMLLAPVSAFAQKGPYVYVALGDSLAAGQTPFKNADGSLNYDSSYSDYLAKHFPKSPKKFEYVDGLGLSGETSSGLLTKVTTNVNYQKALSKANMVTIDIGANDVLPLIVALQRELNQSTPNPTKIQILRNQLENVAIPTLGKNLAATLATIRTVNTTNYLKIYVMGYYNALPYFPAKDQAYIMPLLEKFNQVIEMAADSQNAIFVETGDVIAKNVPKYLPNPLDVHLSTKGYKAIADEFWKAIDPIPDYQ
jgi:lysophospholipase L1-like esterase